MEFKRIEETAVTPEIGGYFGDLKLILKPNLPAAQLALSKKWRKKRYDSAAGAEVIWYDPEQVVDEYHPRIMAHIAGWENLSQGGKPLQFNKENLEYFYMNLQGKHTSHEKEFEKDDEEPGKRAMKLHEFIADFIGNVENFQKN